MKSLQLLLVSIPNTWRDTLTKSLQASGYPFDISEAEDKRDALRACSQYKFDLLIANHQLPDGSPKDLVNVLSGSMASLVLYRNHAPESWIAILGQTLDDWKNHVQGKAQISLQNQQRRYATAIERCAHELQTLPTHAVDRTLRVVLDVMEVSRVYIRETPVDGISLPRVTHEVAAPGHLPILGSRRSAYEVSVQRADGRVLHLGVEDITHQRLWSQFEIDLIQTVAHLLKDNSGNGYGAANFNLGVRISA